MGEIEAMLVISTLYVAPLKSCLTMGIMTLLESNAVISLEW